MKLVDLGELPSFLDHEYLGCKSNKRIEEYRKCSNLGSLPEQPKSHLVGKTRTRIRSLGLVTWKVMRRNAWNDIANWRIEKAEQLYKVSTRCLDDRQFKKEEPEMDGEWSEGCSQSVLKCLYLAPIGGPDIQCSVNKLARAVTKWTRVCDKRLARVISDIHHTSDYGQHCHVGNAAQLCRLGLFQDSDFAGDLEDSASTSGEFYVSLGVLHSSTESEVISLDAGLRITKIQHVTRKTEG